MKIQINTQKIVSFTIAYMVSFLGLLNGINASTNAIGFNTSLDTLVMYVMLWGLAAFVWYSMIRRLQFKADVFLLTAFFIFMLTVTLLFFPENTKYIHSSVYTYANHPLVVLFVYSFTGYAAIRCLNSYEDLLKYLRGFSYIVILFSAIVYFWIKDSFANQYMTLSYNMLLQVCFLLFFPTERRKLLNYMFIGTGIFIIVFGGARGAMVALLLAVIFKIIGFESTIEANRKKIATALLLLIGCFAYLFYEQLLIIMNTFIENLGFASRNLTLLLTSGGDISTGRFEIYLKILNSTKLFGGGFYGDRLILEGTYAHNLFVEWIADFGLLGGPLLIIAYIALLVGGYRRGDVLSRKLMLVFIPNGFVSLVFSSSYLAQQPAFYILLGMCTSIVLRKDRRYDNESL